MGTYTQILYQIVFSTSNNKNTLEATKCEELYKYIEGLLINKKCHLYRIGGTPNHLHIVTHIHPTVSLASLVKDIKLASTEYIKRKRLFQYFSGWQNGYGAFTYSIQEKDRLIEYVKNQEAHHHKNTFKKELINLFTEQGIDYNEKYLL